MEKLCQQTARYGYCWGILKHCYSRVGQRWTKIGTYCVRCGHFEPVQEFRPVRPESATKEVSCQE